MDNRFKIPSAMCKNFIHHIGVEIWSYSLKLKTSQKLPQAKFSRKYFWSSMFLEGCSNKKGKSVPLYQIISDMKRCRMDLFLVFLPLQTQNGLNKADPQNVDIFRLLLHQVQSSIIVCSMHFLVEELFCIPF